LTPEANLDQWVADNSQTLVDEWRDCCRFPSVSGAMEASTATAEWIRARLDDLFDTVFAIDNPGYGPTLIATIAGRSPRRLLIYSHYDVQPVGDLGAWPAPPFAAEIVDGAVVARGCCDDKADITARLQALRHWRETWNDGTPPYTIIWLCEGAEEVGSPGLDELLTRHQRNLSADWCLWESFIRSDDGRPEIAFGCRGIALLEVELRTLAHDQHAAFAPIFRSAAVELAHAISSLADTRGNVLVAGFYDNLLPFTDDEREAGGTVTPPGGDQGVDEIGPHLPGWSKKELAERLLYAPTLNVSALSAGDIQTGTGIVTSVARAHIDLHLVPDQDPQLIGDLVRAHLDQHGFGNVKLTVKATRRPAKSPIDTPLGRAAITAAGETMGRPIIYPLLPGAGPARSILDTLGASTVSPAGTTRLASGIHAAGEHGAISDYLDHVRFAYRTFERLAEEIEA